MRTKTNLVELQNALREVSNAYNGTIVLAAFYLQLVVVGDKGSVAVPCDSAEQGVVKLNLADFERILRMREVEDVLLLTDNERLWVLFDQEGFSCRI